MSGPTWEWLRVRLDEMQETGWVPRIVTADDGRFTVTLGRGEDIEPWRVTRALLPESGPVAAMGGTGAADEMTAWGHVTGLRALAVSEVEVIA